MTIELSHWSGDAGSPAPSWVSKLAVVIPALNEEQTVGTVVSGGAATDSAAWARSRSSSSTTARPMRRAISARGGRRPDHRPPPQPRTRRLLQPRCRPRPRRGADVVVHLDADGQHDPALIPSLVAPIVSGEADSSSACARSPMTETGTSVRRYGNRLAVLALPPHVQGARQRCHLRVPGVLARGTTAAQRRQRLHVHAREPDPGGAEAPRGRRGADPGDEAGSRRVAHDALGAPLHRRHGRSGYANDAPHASRCPSLVAPRSSCSSRPSSCTPGSSPATRTAACTFRRCSRRCSRSSSA